MPPGIWVKYVKSTHPYAYDPDLGPPTGQQRFQIGEIIQLYEGDTASPPPMGSAEPSLFELVCYQGATITAFLNILPMGETIPLKALRETVPGHLEVRPFGQLVSNVKQKA